MYVTQVGPLPSKAIPQRTDMLGTEESKELERLKPLLHALHSLLWIFLMIRERSGSHGTAFPGPFLPVSQCIHCFSLCTGQTKRHKKPQHAPREELPLCLSLCAAFVSTTLIRYLAFPRCAMGHRSRAGWGPILLLCLSKRIAKMRGEGVGGRNHGKIDVNSLLKAKQMKIIFTAPQLFYVFFLDQIRAKRGADNNPKFE